MALPILDGNQSATTLSSILTSGEHIPAHTVVSLGTQAITNIATAVSGSVVSISNFPATQPVSIASVTIGSLPLIAGTVTANISAVYAGEAPFGQVDNPMMAVGGLLDGFNEMRPIRIDLNTGGQIVVVKNSVTIGSLPLIAGTVTANPTGTQTIAGTVTLGAGTAQIGSVTASISNFPATQAISIASVTVGNSVTVGSLPLIAGTVTANLGDGVSSSTLNAVDQTKAVAVQIFDEDGNIRGGFDALLVKVSEIQTSIESRITNSDGNPIDNSNPLPISGTVTANTFALQGTAVTTSDFTSTTASTLLAGFNAGREVLTIFSEGPGTLFVCPGATCTTIAYQIRLSSGDYYEVPNHQTTITHSAVFQTAGTARVTEVS